MAEFSSSTVSLNPTFYEMTVHVQLEVREAVY